MRRAIEHKTAGRTRLRLITLVGALLVGPLLCEGMLRSILFGEGWWSRTFAEFRAPELYADAENEELYWRLRAATASPPQPTLPDIYDSLLGWRSGRIAPETYAPRVWPPPPAMRPIALYGSSFAACLTNALDCFQGLAARSDIGETHATFNYGVGGYGLDQVFMLLRLSVGHFAERDGRIVVGIVPAEDIDRVVLGFREWPKPRFRVSSGVLVEPEPVTRGSDRYLASHPAETRSFLWRYLLHGTDVLPERWKQRARRTEVRENEKRAVARALLAEIQVELERAGVEYFALLFHARTCLESGGAPWEDDFVIDTLAELDFPFVDTRVELTQDRSTAGRAWSDYYFTTGNEVGHLNALGNETCFRTLRRGLQGR